MRAQSRTEKSDLRELCSLRNSMYPESIRQGKDLGLENQKLQQPPAGLPAFFMACGVERIEDQECAVA